MSERINSETPEQKTRRMVAMYTDGAQGVVDVHVYSYQGEVQKQFVKAAGVAIDETIHHANLYGFDGDANPVKLTYDGIMTPQACQEQADKLQAALETSSL